MKSESWLIVELGAALIGLAILAFFHAPVYEKCVWFIVGVLATQFGNVMGYKFGRSMPQQTSDPKAGQASTSDIKTTSVAVPVDSVETPKEK